MYITILILFLIGVLIEHYRLFKAFKKIKEENLSLKNKCTQLEKEVRAEANKNIILQSVINQKTNQ